MRVFYFHKYFLRRFLVPILDCIASPLKKYFVLLIMPSFFRFLLEKWWFTYFKSSFVFFVRRDMLSASFLRSILMDEDLRASWNALSTSSLHVFSPNTLPGKMNWEYNSRFLYSAFVPYFLRCSSSHREILLVR